MLAEAGPAEHSASFVVSTWKVTLMPRAGTESARLKTNGTDTHGCCADRHTVLVLAATTEADGMRNTSIVYVSRAEHPNASVTPSVKDDEPAVVGVPLSSPVAGASARPSG